MTDAAIRHMKKRHAAEARFRLYGRIAIVMALGFLAILLVRIGMQGYTTFTTHWMSLPVYLDPAAIDPAEPRSPARSTPASAAGTRPKYESAE